MAKLKYSVRFVSFPCIHRTMTPRRIIGNHPESITVLANEPDGHRKVALTSLKQPEKGQNTGKKKTVYLSIYSSEWKTDFFNYPFTL